MKLYVDDIRNAPDESWSVARTCLSAIRFISRFSPEEISLDHDISHQVAVSAISRPFPCEETFESVAHFIAAHYANKPKPKMVIHTSNPVGGETMRQILDEALIPDIVIKRTGPANRLEMESK